MLQPTPLSALAALAFAWVSWRILSALFLPHPLDRIPGLKAPSWIGGSLMQVFDQDGWNFHDHMADKHGGLFRFQGFFGARSLYVHDPKALHHIVLKDQHLYDPTDDMILTNNLVFGQGLISTRGMNMTFYFEVNLHQAQGNHHRKQRKMLNPVFSRSHIRDMTPIAYQVSQELCESLSRQIQEDANSVDMLEWLTRTALEFLGRGIMGSSFDALNPDADDHPYWISIKNLPRVLTLPEFMFPRFFILPYLGNIGTAGFRRWIINMLPWKNLHVLRDMVDVMHNTSVSIFESRKETIIKGLKESPVDPGRDKDILSILLKANLSASDEDRLPESELLAQLSTVTFAAMDTTSNTIARILYLLCEKPEVQEKLRREITEAISVGEEIQYDELMTLPFLDAVYKETLRVFTPVPLLVKQSQQDAVLPFSKPFMTAEGSHITEVLVPQKTYLVLSLNGCNRDPEIWGTDAREWKPERWLTPPPETASNAKVPGVYSHLMTFYGGSHACIGFKFAELEMKMVLSMLLGKFRFAFGDQKIIWKMNGVNQPMTRDAELDAYGLPRLQLPLHVSTLPKS